MLSKQTQEFLSSAGWSISYHYDLTSYLRFMEAKDCVPPEVVQQFLSRFGGILIQYPHPQLKSIFVTMEINPLKGLKALQGDVCDDLNSYSERIGNDRLFFIGWFNNGYIELMMDSNGVVYGAYNEILYKIANSGIEAIEIICNGGELQKID